MDHHRLPFLHSPTGHHQRALLYHPRPRLQMGMLSPPIYDGLLPPTNRHSLSASAMNFPRPYPEDYPPSFLTGPSPGAYGLMGLPSGSSYPMLVDYNYGFPGGYPPLPMPPLPPHSSFMSLRKPSDDSSQYPTPYHQAHMDALQDQVNSFLRRNGAPDPGKPTQRARDKLPDWTCIEAALPGRRSNGLSSSDTPASRLPTLPRLHTASDPPLDHFVSLPQRGVLSGWHSTFTPPPLHLPTVKHSGHHATLDHNGSDVKKRKLGSDARTQNGVLSEDMVNDLFREHFVAKIPKLPPLLIGNKDLAKKLTAEVNGGEALNLSSEKSTARRRLASTSPDGERNRVMVDRRTWEPVDGRNQSIARDESPSGGTGRLLRDDGFVRDPLGASENKSSTSSYPPPHPYPSNCLTDVEAMRSAYVTPDAHEQSLSSESSAQFSPALLPPPPPLGFRGRGCFGGKRRRVVSPPGGVQRSAVFSPRSVAPLRTEYGRTWDWAYESDSRSLDCGAPGKTIIPDVVDFSSSGSVLYHAGHNAVPPIVNEESRATAQIRIKEEPIESNPFSQSVNESFGSHNGEDRVCGGDKGQGLASTVDPRDVVRPGKYDHDQSRLQEDTNNHPNVPFVDSTSGGLLSPGFEPSGNPASGFRLAEKGAGDGGSAEFRCHLCNYNGRSQTCLDKHFRAHGQACKICRYCLKAFERPSDLVRHEERHQKRNHMPALTPSERRPASRFTPMGKRMRRRTTWTCRQCHFTCHEARKLIQHTRRAHPIFVDCPICGARFLSEAEVATHRAECHPIAVGRLDTYCHGVLTATTLVTCGVVGEQEVAVTLAELSELPSDCSGIPLVSSVRDVQCILGKDGVDYQCSGEDLGCVSHTEVMSQVCNLSPEEPLGTHLAPEEYHCPGAKSPKSCTDSTNVGGREDAGCLDTVVCDSLSSPPTTVLTLLTIPKTDDVGVVNGNACKIQPHCLKDVHREKPVDADKVSEMSPLASLRQTESCREGDVATSRPPLHNSISTLESSPKFYAASHQKPSLLTKLLTKPRPAKPATPLANKRTSEAREKQISRTDCALGDNNKSVSTGFDNAESTTAAENGTNTSEKGTPPITIPKKEQTTSKGNRSTNNLCKMEISMSDEDRTRRKSSGATDSRKVFAEHNGVEKKSEMYVCVRCKYSTNAKFKYQQHLKAHAGRFICKRCNKACIKSSDLYRHWVTHNIKGPDGYFACDSCDFTSPQKYVVEEHMKQHYTLNPEQPQRLLSAMSRCGLCQKNVLRARLFEHKRVVHGKFFLKQRRVDADTGRVDERMDANGNSIKASLKVFACPQCDRKFTTPSYLLRHHFVHHQPSDSGPTKLEENSCSCRFCGVKFEDVDRLQDHEINHILQTCTDSEYVERCRKRKRRPSAAAPEHSSPLNTKSLGPKESHGVGGEREKSKGRLNCPHCKKTFKVQYYLDQHLRIHSSERPFVCQACGMGFPIFQRLNIHRRFKCSHQKTLSSSSTKKPLLNSCSVNAPVDAFSIALPGSSSGRAALNGLDCSDRKDCLEVLAEHAVDVSG